MPCVARGRLRVQGRGRHAAIFREDTTLAHPIYSNIRPSVGLAPLHFLSRVPWKLFV